MKNQNNVHGASLFCNLSLFCMLIQNRRTFKKNLKRITAKHNIVKCTNGK